MFTGHIRELGVIGSRDGEHVQIRAPRQRPGGGGLGVLAAGGGVAVWDPDAENEGDVIFAGEQLRPDAFRFLLTEVCGHPTVPCAAEILDRLDIGETSGGRPGRDGR